MIGTGQAVEDMGEGLRGQTEHCGGARTRQLTKRQTAKILGLLKRPDGATSKELMKATGRLPRSVRGLLCGTVRKKMGLTVTSTKGEDGERTYSVEA
jgi:hypothetical protein